MRRLETLGFRKTLPRPQKWVYLLAWRLTPKDQGKWSLSDRMLDTWHGLRFMWTRTKRRETLQLVSRIQKGQPQSLVFREKGISGRTHQKWTITIKTKEMPRASLCLLYPRGKPELKTKLREEGTTPGTGEDNNQSRKMDCFQRTRSTRH